MNTPDLNYESNAVKQIEQEIKDRTSNLQATLEASYTKLTKLEIEAVIEVIKSKLRATMYSILFTKINSTEDTTEQVETLESSLNLVLAIASETLIELNNSR